MKLVTVSTVFILSCQSLLGSTDTLTPKREKRNLFEFGKVYSNLMNGCGFRGDSPENTGNYFDKRNNLSISYTRILKYNFCARVQYYRILNDNQPNWKKTAPELQRGDVFSTYFRSVKFSVGKRFKAGNFFILPTVSGNYRWGSGENIFWGWMLTNPYHGRISDWNSMKSYGIGAGCLAGYSFFNRITLTCDLSYSYNYEKLHDIRQGHEPGYFESGVKPNRQYLILNFNIGYMF